MLQHVTEVLALAAGLVDAHDLDGAPVASPTACNAHAQRTLPAHSTSYSSLAKGHEMTSGCCLQTLELTTGTAINLEQQYRLSMSD